MDQFNEQREIPVMGGTGEELGLTVREKLLRYIFPFLAIALISGSSCSNDQAEELKAEKVVSYADTLQEAIERFEESRSGAIVELEKLTERTVSALAKDDPNPKDVASTWEKGWVEVASKFKDLDKQLSLIQMDSVSYFDKLDELAEAIVDSKTKDSESLKNTKVHDAWSKALDQGVQDIIRLSDILIEGDDFHKVLLAGILRVQIEDDIVELGAISDKALGILTALEKLTIEGRKLGGG